MWGRGRGRWGGREASSTVALEPVEPSVSGRASNGGVGLGAGTVRAGCLGGVFISLGGFLHSLGGVFIDWAWSFLAVWVGGVAVIGV